MAIRLITPSQLSLFSRSPVIGAWWEEVHFTEPKRAPRPEVKALDDLLFEAGHKHEQVLIAQLKRENKRVAELRGKQDSSDYEECIEANADCMAAAEECNAAAMAAKCGECEDGDEECRG